MSIRRTVNCMCDSCGKKKRCPADAKGPQGWFWFDINDPDDQTLLVTVLACSPKCKTIAWQRVPKTTKTKARATRKS